jgi:hypothetical protein
LRGSTWAIAVTCSSRGRTRGGRWRRAARTWPSPTRWQSASTSCRGSRARCSR